MARSMNLGMPRIGPRRELKRAVEGYWAGTTDARHLAEVARDRRASGWREQAAAGIAGIASNDFSLYDHVLDTTCLVGAVPPRFGFAGGPVDLDTYFSLARGTTQVVGSGTRAVAPLEMTKWFDTNYHYLVPELGPDTAFALSSTKPVDEFGEALALGIPTRPVLLGPVTYLLLSKSTVPGFSPLELLPVLLPVYGQVLDDLAAAGARWIQLDEPVLGTDLDDEARTAVDFAYTELARRTVKILVAISFSGLGPNLELATGLPVAGLHVDLVRDPGQLPALLDQLDADTVLSAGVVDGRNVWRNDLRATLGFLEAAQERLGDRLWVGPSCSLRHVPHDLSAETALLPDLTRWLAFASQKLSEIVALTDGLSEGPAVIADALRHSDGAVEERRLSDRITRGGVRHRVEALSDGDAVRHSPYRRRRVVQGRSLPLPPLPTTTIGSFPQTAEIRAARQRHASGELTDDGYRRFCENEIAQVVRQQEALGLDVLVHGEPERNDMVQYFGERLDGFASTSHGWVQSYGTRYVRPPILYGDVERPAPITVDWSRYAQSLTDLPVKGMLTGPVTILQWSFVRDDQPRAQTCRQIALAVRDEVLDLESAGIRIIQVDEPALREGLPLRHGDRAGYLAWATECFKVATAAVDDGTQIHTHMCYAEFGDIMDAVVALDVDVISIEAARSQMDLLTDLAAVDYAAGIGLGVYDIHSPTVPSTDEIAAFIEQALRVLPPEQLWVNPDCGLKTRRGQEVAAALSHMVAAAHRARQGAPGRRSGGRRQGRARLPTVHT
ncbi:MAG TPA: 5-methyltetrahydropteroyltriglutamate--homocysteine S-methyltransferase [Acidimicrobiales bacterium]|nr:5-methyltetrahydropteroyltriglutamate--homocysteine S-methyltransferase [Acidimicrobiales bacterium]